MSIKTEVESNEVEFSYCKQSYEKALLNVMYIHVLMFFITLFIGIIAKSSAIIADSLDYIGDAGSYFLSIWVLYRSLRLRTYVALFKATTVLIAGAMMSIMLYRKFGLLETPDSLLMQIAGALGIAAHLVCMRQLFKFRSGDSNMLSAWVCTFNDMICNILVIISSIFVVFTNSPIPDIITACIIIVIAMVGSVVIFKKAIEEIIYEQHNKS